MRGLCSISVVKRQEIMIRRQWWHGEMEGNNLQELPSHNTPTAAPRCVSPQAAAMNTLPAPYFLWPQTNSQDLLPT